MNDFTHRTRLLLGDDAFEKIRKRTIFLAGVGAVGSVAMEALLRTGFTKFRIFDKDRFELSNLNRQLYALRSTVGLPKIQVARDRAADINPDAEVIGEEIFLDDENIPTLLENGDNLIVIDAVDDVRAKCGLAAVCIQRSIPVIASMGAARKKDPSLIRCEDISRTHTCPLARRVRKNLKMHGIEKGLKCVFSAETAAPHADLLPSMMVVTAAFGLRIAAEALNMALE